MKALQTIAAGILILGMGSAFAAEPVALSDSQMDKVSAGAGVIVSATGSGLGYGVAFVGTAAEGVAAKANSPLGTIGITQTAGVGLGAGITIGPR